MKRMFYRIKFKAAPQEYVFEMDDVKHIVIVNDVLHMIRNDNLILLDENCTMLVETDEIHNARTYTVKRIPKDTNRRDNIKYIAH